MDRGRTGVRAVVGEHKRLSRRDRLTASKEVDTKPIRTSGSPGTSSWEVAETLAGKEVALLWVEE